MNDSRLIAFGIWGVGMIILYGFILARRSVAWRRKREDPRRRRDVIEASGLFLVALASAASVFSALFATDATGVRVTLSAVAAGALLAVGVVMASERDDAPPPG
jgi:Na+/H+ antiporter NhaD/arsenite permease-like protein